jgi:hypothetical protein
MVAQPVLVAAMSGATADTTFFSSRKDVLFLLVTAA